jgi:hypothetical protein
MYSPVGSGTNTLKIEYNIIKKQLKYSNDGIFENKM